ncbi:MAG: thiolase domain-containing protein [Chloroflexi bacterium]|nr:thiolase domain-containing protein [Chloroflexota bacterium]
MTDIVIAGIGQTEVGEHWDISLRELAFMAIKAAVQDSGGLRPQALFAGNMLAPNLSNQAHLATLLADYAGLTGIEAATIEAAGASGGAALRQGYIAIKSGLVDVALVIGVEKFTDKIGSDVEWSLATASDSDYEAVQGMTVTAQAALLMQRYMHEYHVPANGFAGFPVTAHANGVGNKFAMFQKAIKPETYAKAEMVCEPINMFDAAPNADGAAALILTRRDLLPKEFNHPQIKIAGSANSTDTLALHDRQNLLEFQSTQIAVEQALKKAGIGLEQVDFFEYHDAFSIYAALSLEAAGFAARGEGWKLASDGSITLKGKIPCATMGGLKARGFAGGATGVYQAVEAALQLRGEAGPNQLNGARYGLIQSLGGPASTTVCHILEKIS